MEDRYTIQSVQKALRVLRLFLESGRGFSFTDVVLACPGMNRSNVLRILSTLRGEGFLYFDQDVAIITEESSCEIDFAALDRDENILGLYDVTI